MASHIFHELYIHLNWHTKDDQALLDKILEPQVHAFLEQRCKATRGIWFHGIGGTATHIHLVVQIEPTICISDFAGDIKGACSREINARQHCRALEWQRGFGVVSFGKKTAWLGVGICGSPERTSPTGRKATHTVGKRRFCEPVRSREARLKPADELFIEGEPPAEAGGKGEKVG